MMFLNITSSDSGAWETYGPYNIIIGASRSKPHIDELNVRNVYTTRHMQGMI